MSVVGIVCEYNPMHLGHEYQIQRTKELLGEDTSVVCVMSGDFVQRGEAAVFSKFARAEAACRCGADLVVELPLPWVLSSAEGFAAGAVSILNRLGADYISFGSECGSIEALTKIAETISAVGFQENVKLLLGTNANLSYTMAREKVLKETVGDMAELISEPNNILAIEYIKAIIEQKSDMKPVTIKRIGSGHDEHGACDGPKSASEIRYLMAEGQDVSPYIPKEAFVIYNNEVQRGRSISAERIETAVLSRLRMLDVSFFENLRDGANGVGMRVYNAIQSENSLHAIAEKAKAKRYAYSRIKRLCMNAALGIKKEDAEGLPQFTRILAMNNKGKEILRNVPESNLTIITKPASARQQSTQIKDTFIKSANAHDLFVLCYENEKARNCGEDWRVGPKIVHNV